MISTFLPYRTGPAWKSAAPLPQNGFIRVVSYPPSPAKWRVDGELVKGILRHLLFGVSDTYRLAAARTITAATEIDLTYLKNFLFI